MWLPRQFREDSTEVAIAMVRSAGFGHLVVAGPDGLDSTPVPFVISDDGERVRAHLARPNTIWKLAPCEAMLLVPVSDAYISPSWYPAKAEHGRVVPTWNYEVVHLHGRLIAHDDAGWTATMVSDLTDVNEAGMPTPWSVDDAPADYTDQLIGGIVGIELEVVRIEAKRKLSQNKSDADRDGAIAGLAGSPLPRSDAVRRAMDHPSRNRV
jgi:transcriptional regulator